MCNTLKNRVKKFLEFSKISQAEFGKLANVSVAYVANIRNNMTIPVLESLKKINPSLSLDWLLLGRGEMLAPTAAEILEREAEIKANYSAELEKLQKINNDLAEKVAMLEEIRALKAALQTGKK